MGRLSRAFVIMMVLSLISLTLTTGCVSDRSPYAFLSYYTYELKIKTSEPITNATFFIPLPVKNGVPIVGMLSLKEDDFKKENLLIGIIRFPPGLNLTGTYPVQNNEPVYLKISSDRIYLNKTQNSEYIVHIENLTWRKTPLLFTDTLNPINNEIVFLPKMDFSPSTPTMINRTSAHWIEYIPIKSPQKTTIYAEYSASSSTFVDVSFSIHGSNGWRYSDDSGGGNSYWDYFEWSHTGESHGWQIADGTYKAAEGVYPNMDLPEWQKTIKSTRDL